ncbi:MAG: NAD(P)/FAD-dependent oxidoreductase [Clostridia bacterium]|nr:NAD(P)/FAD-dependent oxidoreductase [Clostridia bacterium]
MFNDPIRVGSTTLKNRVVFPPLTTGYEERDGSIGKKSFNFYRRLAQGGAGYIVLGDVAPINTASPTPKLCSDAQTASFKSLADACHEYGAKLSVQIFYPEYDAVGVGKLIMQSRMLAMQGKKEECEKVTNAAYAKLHHDMLCFVNEASEEQLDEIVGSFTACALRAKAAGIDAVMIHGDRLIGSLCSPILNKRTDQYGGSFENRTRFAIRITRALRAAVPDMILDYKLPVITPADGGWRGKGGLPLEEAVELARLLEKEGVDMFHVAQANHTGNMGDTIPAMGTRKYGWTVYCAEAVKKAVSVPVCAVGRITTETEAEAVLASGKCDLVGLGRGLLCDPDFALKAAAGEPVRHCIFCNKGCTDAIMNRTICRCVLNAENGDEYDRVITKAETAKKVAVVGAGIAGLEAARVAAIKGHDVTVYEKTLKIGGQMNISCIPPRKGEMVRGVNYYSEILPKLGVKFVMGVSPDKDTLNGYDDVIVAVGAKNMTLPVPGADGVNVVSAWDVLEGKCTPFGKVSVIGGGLVGAETAEYLASTGCEVSIIEMLPKIAAGESSTVLPDMMADLNSHNVRMHVNTRLMSIGRDSVTCAVTAEGKEETVEIPSDFVVMAVGAKPNAFDTEGITARLHFCGDCVKPADISAAVRAAYDEANSIS